MIVGVSSLVREATDDGPPLSSTMTRAEGNGHTPWGRGHDRGSHSSQRVGTHWE